MCNMLEGHTAVLYFFDFLVAAEWWPACFCVTVCCCVVLQAESIHVNPLYMLIPAALCVSFSFLLPSANPPNAIVFSYGHLTTLDMVSILFKVGFFLEFEVLLRQDSEDWDKKKITKNNERDRDKGCDMTQTVLKARSPWAAILYTVRVC